MSEYGPDRRMYMYIYVCINMYHMLAQGLAGVSRLFCSTDSQEPLTNKCPYTDTGSRARCQICQIPKHRGASAVRSAAQGGRKICCCCCYLYLPIPPLSYSNLLFALLRIAKKVLLQL